MTKPWESDYVCLVEPETVGNALCECAAEITRLHKIEAAAKLVLAACEKERDEWKAATVEVGLVEVRQQLAACEKERDDLLARWNKPVVESEWQKLVKERDECNNQYSGLEKMYIECQKERDEWRNEVLRLHDIALGEEGKRQLAAMTKERDELLRKVEYWRDIAKFGEKP